MSTLPRVLVTRVIPDDGLRPIREACTLDLWEGELPPPRGGSPRRTDMFEGASGGRGAR